MRYRLILPDRIQGPVLEFDSSEVTPAQLKAYNEKGYNIYYFPNGSSTKLDHNLKALDVDTFDWVFVDVDLKDGIYHKLSDFIRELDTFPVKPTKCVKSGHGIHTYWRISDLTRDSYLHLQKALIYRFKSDKSVWTIAQLMRMPGYYNTKSTDLVMCEYIEENDLTYTCADLWKHLEPITFEDKKVIDNHINKHIHGIKITTDQLRIVPLPEKFEHMLDKSAELNEWFYNPTDRSECDIKIANALQINGFSREDALSIMAQTQKGSERGAGYVQSTVDKVYDNPLTMLDEEYEQIHAAVSVDQYYDNLAKENKRYKIEKEYHQIVEARKVEILQDKYTLHGSESELSAYYVGRIKAKMASRQQRLTFITPLLTRVMPLYGDNVILIAAKTGNGKCFSKGTKVRMFDGSVKNVEDIVLGDIVMGSDSTPRTVQSLHRGVDQLYDVIPVKGDKYTVNSKHELVLQNYKKGEVVVSVEDYLNFSKTEKHVHKGIRVAVSYPDRSVLLDPYFLGLWLGDGTSAGTGITNVDSEITDYLHRYCDTLNTPNEITHFVRDSIDTSKAPTFTISTGNVSGYPTAGRNKVRSALSAYNLLHNKHIPTAYLTNSREVRLQLLAGIIDTDGCVSYNGWEIVQKNKQLALDIQTLCRSLGFACYIKECKKTCCNNGSVGTYYRMFVHGKGQEDVPCLISRKKLGERRQIKNVLKVGIKVKKAYVGEYFGFSLDGDKKFLLEDFTVVHNSSNVANIIAPLLREGKSMACISTEETSEDTLFRNYCLQHDLNVANSGFWYNEKHEQQFQQEVEGYLKSKQLQLYDSYTYGTDKDTGAKIKCPEMTSIEGLLTALSDIEKSPRLPDVLLVDYISKIGSSKSVRNEAEWQIIYKAAAILEEWCKKLNIPSIIFSQLEDESQNRTSFKSRLPGSKRIMNLVTVAIELDVNYEEKTTQYICHKNRMEQILFRKTVRYDRGLFVDSPAETDTVEEES